MDIDETVPTQDVNPKQVKPLKAIPGRIVMLNITVGLVVLVILAATLLVAISLLG